MSNLRFGLRIKSVMVMVMAAVLSLLLYYGLVQVGNRMLDQYFLESDYIEKATDRTAEKLQEYITKNQLKTTEDEMLDAWNRKHLLVYYIIYQNGQPVYDSFYTDLGEESEENYSSDRWYMEDSKEYQLTFADGEATVYLMGFFEYQFYDLANYIELAISGIFFILIFVLFLQRKIRYVRMLEEEIKILEGGGMDKQITVKGRDELSELASGLEQMRCSVNENMLQKEELLDANSRLVTGMAHDLRTPLTTLLLYTELLQKGKYKNEEELKQYLEKTSEKAVQIKRMSDQLFARFYISGKQGEQLELPMLAEYIFQDELSDFVMFLESQGFQVDCTIEWPDLKVAVVTEYIARIFDNISSNLLKYADPQEKIQISLHNRKDGTQASQRNAGQPTGFVELSFQNRIRQEAESRENTQVGVRNIKQMIQRMSGSCRMEQSDETYEIHLFFPAREARTVPSKNH